MKLLRLCAVAAASCALWGCASPGPTYRNVTTPDAARVSGKEGMMFTSSHDADASILEIDGLEIPHNAFRVGAPKLSVSPGMHRLTLAYAGYGYLIGQETIEMEFAAKRIYRIVSERMNEEFEIVIWDETEGHEKRTEIRRWRIRGRRASAGGTIPIYVPVK